MEIKVDEVKNKDLKINLQLRSTSRLNHQPRLEHHNTYF